MSLAASLLGDLGSPHCQQLVCCSAPWQENSDAGARSTHRCLCNYHPGSWSDASYIKSPWEATCSRGQSPCLVTSVTQGSPRSAQGRCRWSRKAGLPLVLLHRARRLSWLRPRGALRSLSYSQPPSPSVPFLPQVGVHGDGTEKENSSQDELWDWRQEPTSCHSLPALTWL